jgi:hypothetical protein
VAGWWAGWAGWVGGLAGWLGWLDWLAGWVGWLGLPTSRSEREWPSLAIENPHLNQAAEEPNKFSNDTPGYREPASKSSHRRSKKAVK